MCGRLLSVCAWSDFCLSGKDRGWGRELEGGLLGYSSSILSHPLLFPPPPSFPDCKKSGGVSQLPRLPLQEAGGQWASGCRLYQWAFLLPGVPSRVRQLGLGLLVLQLSLYCFLPALTSSLQQHSRIYIFFGMLMSAHSREKKKKMAEEWQETAHCAAHEPTHHAAHVRCKSTTVTHLGNRTFPMHLQGKNCGKTYLRRSTPRARNVHSGDKGKTRFSHNVMGNVKKRSKTSSDGHESKMQFGKAVWLVFINFELFLKGRCLHLSQYSRILLL